MRTLVVAYVVSTVLALVLIGLTHERNVLRYARWRGAVIPPQDFERGAVRF
jgi:hypothetical protein